MSTAGGINGFGRIRRLVVRALHEQGDLELVHSVNEPFADAANGGASVGVRHRPRTVWRIRFGERRSVGDRPARRSATRRSRRRARCRGQPPTSTSCWNAPASSALSRYSSPYFDRGIGKVIVAAPVKDDRALNIVMGCNDHLYDASVHHIVTAASCTTNCLAPVVKVLHEQIGIERGVSPPSTTPRTPRSWSTHHTRTFVGHAPRSTRSSRPRPARRQRSQ